jgi:UDP-glucose 4-epimerase
VKVVVTGAAGFLGSHLLERLVTDGHEVTGLDDLSTGHLSNLAAARRRKGFSFHHFDVTTPLVADAIRRAEPDVVVHLAPVLPLHLLASLGGARLVVAGSAEVYGGVPGPVTERYGLHPGNLAGAHHAAVEAYVHAYVVRGLKAVTLRLTAVYGPRSRGLVTTWVKGMSARRSTCVHGDGTAVRDLVHVDDVVDAFLRTLGGRADGRRLNIGTGVGTTVRTLHSKVARLVGAPDAPEFLPARPEDLASSVVDPGAARRALGWEPLITLDDGLRRVVEDLQPRR